MKWGQARRPFTRSWGEADLNEFTKAQMGATTSQPTSYSSILSNSSLISKGSRRLGFRRSEGGRRRGRHHRVRGYGRLGQSGNASSGSESRHSEVGVRNRDRQPPDQGVAGQPGPPAPTYFLHLVLCRRHLGIGRREIRPLELQHPNPRQCAAEGMAQAPLRTSRTFGG